MKKRAKQLAMLGLTVTMMCGTQMTAFASGLGEEAPVAIETEAKETASEETEEVKVEAKEEKADAKEEVKTEVKEEVVTGTEVAETPVVEETEVKETVAGTEELVGLGVSVEAEAETVETEAPAVPQTDVEADAPVVIPETEETNKVAEPKLSVTSNIATFDGTQDIVLTFKVDGLEGDFTWNTDVFSIAGSVVGSIEEQISKNEYRVTLRKDHLLDNIKKQNYKNGQTIEIKAGGWAIEYDDENGERKEFGFPSTFVTYSDGTVTPEPEKPQPEPEKPQPDGGNGGTETPDPEKDGWIKTEEGWKYYENGQKATGWKAVSENWYYFNEDGIMATGWVSVGGHWYYLNSSGAMETGWTSVGSHWYYLNADGTMATGWVSIGGHWYYLNADGSMATGWASVGGHWYYLNTDGSMATGWVSVGGHWYYLNTDGSMASSQWIDGWYVDASGKML